MRKALTIDERGLLHDFLHKFIIYAEDKEILRYSPYTSPQETLEILVKIREKVCIYPKDSKWRKRKKLEKNQD